MRHKILRHRIQQADVAVLALQLAAKQRSGHITTEALREFLADKFKPTQADATHISGSQEPVFNQIVRNVICNRHAPESMFSMGYALYKDEGIEITDKGRAFLLTVPQ